ncbi:MAG: M64 family metallopeptidase [Acidobacteriota bacterium]
MSHFSHTQTTSRPAAIPSRPLRRALSLCLAAAFAALPVTAAEPALDPLTPEGFDAALEQNKAYDATETPAHYVVVQTVGNAPLDVTHYRKVALQGPMLSRDDAALDAFAKSLENRQTASAIARLRDDVTGDVVWQTAIKIPRWMRSEVTIPAGDPRLERMGGSNIDGVMLPMTETTFVVRAPVLDGATTLEVTHGGSHDQKALRATETIDLADLERRFPPQTKALPSGTFHEGVPGHFGGPRNNRLDVLFVAEGYSLSSDHWFQFDTDIFTDRFLGETPWDLYAPLMNFYRLFVPSEDNGADRPACDDPDGDGMDNNTFVDTYFDATFCTSDIWRLLTVDNAKVLAAAGDYPDWDEIIVVVQTPFRGGSGGSIATTSLGPGFVIDDDIAGVMVHEFGHSFGDLADEYETAFPGFPMCSDTNASSSDDCEANVTNVTSRSSLKWNRWVASTTAIPTTFPLTDPSAAGLWEGARYQSNNMYRQCFSSKMRNTLSDFCDVDSEALILKLYQGGWGSPSAGVSLIEPGTRVPSSSTIYVGDFESTTVRARVLGPNGSNVRVRWYVNGVLKSTQFVAPFATPSYTHRAGRAGSVDVVQMRVQEQGPVLHSSQRGQSESITTWYVNVQGCQFC